jgi:hypothetical protein
MYLTIKDITWDIFDISMPSLWQLNYVEQLKQQTGVTDFDVQFTRKDYGNLIESLKNLREFKKLNHLIPTRNAI